MCSSPKWDGDGQEVNKTTELNKVPPARSARKFAITPALIAQLMADRQSHSISSTKTATKAY